VSQFDPVPWPFRSRRFAADSKIFDYRLDIAKSSSQPVRALLTSRRLLSMLSHRWSRAPVDRLGLVLPKAFVGLKPDADYRFVRERCVADAH